MKTGKYKDLVQRLGVSKLLLIALAGVLLLVGSVQETKDIQNSDEKKAEVSSGTQTGKENYVQDLEQRLVEMLLEIKGVKNAKVMIMLESTEQKEILREEDVIKEDTSESDSSGGKRDVHSYQKDETMIYVRDAEGKEIPYVMSEQMPEIRGVAVIADGAEDPIIREKIILLIKALFGIEINKIMVTE